MRVYVIAILLMALIPAMAIANDASGLYVNNKLVATPDSRGNIKVSMEELGLKTGDKLKINIPGKMVLLQNNVKSKPLSVTNDSGVVSISQMELPSRATLVYQGSMEIPQNMHATRVNGKIQIGMRPKLPLNVAASKSDVPTIVAEKIDPEHPMAKLVMAAAGQ